jgi:hypothetical protein
MRKKTPFCTSGKVTFGNITIVFGPSAPNRVATIHHSVLAASEQAAFWRTILNSSQKQTQPVSKTHCIRCSSCYSTNMAKGNVDNKAFLDSPLGRSSKHLQYAFSGSNQHNNDQHYDEDEQRKSS